MPYYLKETDDFALLDEQVPFLNPDDPYKPPTSSATVWEHVVLAQRYLLQHLGSHGLSKIYYGDWCDTMNGVGAKGRGESVLLSMQVKWGCQLLAELSDRLAKLELAAEMRTADTILTGNINQHAQKLEPSVVPIINTAHSIRMAKILRQAARALGETADVREYDRDIAELSDLILRRTWDEPAGHFSYLLHDADGNPTGFLRHSSGANFNMGLDGVSPRTAGICTPAQRERLLAHLFSPHELRSAIGLSTVDQSAPYYRPDGYWNGAVWMPHQWFVWKALLDIGRTDEAFRIARTALDVWQREVGKSYYCFEHFIVATGRGAGWYQFDGLSAPVLNWFATDYRPGTLTVGHDGWVEFCEFTKAGLRARIRLAGNRDCPATVIAVLTPGKRYVSQTPFRERLPGTYEFEIPAGQEVAEIELTNGQ